MVGEPRSSSLALNWRADFSFYDRRARLLETLANEGALREWRMQDHVVGARLALNHELLVRCDSFSLACFDGMVDSHVVSHALSAVTHALDLRLEAATLSVQHLEALPGDYDDQARRAAQALFGPLAVNLAADDFALLLSGTAGDVGDYRAEFGIVDPLEAEARLSRTVGQLAEIEAPHSPPDGLDRGDIPEVALFVDSRWHTHAVASAGEEPVESFTEAALRESGVLVDSILGRLQGDQGEQPLRIGAVT